MFTPPTEFDASTDSIPLPHATSPPSPSTPSVSDLDSQLTLPLHGDLRTEVLRLERGGDVRGHSLMTPTSAHLRSPPTYIHISLLSVHSYTYYYSLSSLTSPTFGDVAVYIPFPSSSFHTVPFPFSMIL